jgi:hypothetical protein
MKTTLLFSSVYGIILYTVHTVHTVYCIQYIWCLYQKTSLVLLLIVTILLLFSTIVKQLVENRRQSVSFLLLQNTDK